MNIEILYLATFFVAFISSILSGMAGGGGGFVMSPFWLVAGLSPSQGAATGAFMATGMGASSLAAYRGSGHLPRDNSLVFVLSSVTLLTSIVGAILLPKFESDEYSQLIALVTFAAVPLLFVKRKSVAVPARYQHVGLPLAIVLLASNSLLTSGIFAILFSFTLSSFFEMSVLQATALRRILMIVQSVVLCSLLAVQGYFLWQYGIVAIAGGSLGSYVGTKLSIARGQSFAKYALAAMSCLGALVLLV